MDRRLVTPLLLVVVFSVLTGWLTGHWLLGVFVAAIGVGGVLRRWRMARALD